MNKKRRGFVCIINVSVVHGEDPRHGTDKDRDRLMELFRQLNFDVTVYNDGDGLRADVSYLAVNNSYKFVLFFSLSTSSSSS